MNLVFRILKAIVLALIKPRIEPTEECAVSARVMPWDLDFYWHVTNSRYNSFMDLARMTYFIRSGTWGRARKRGWRPILASSTITFRKPLNLFQKFEIKCQAIGWDDHWFYFQMLFVCNGIAYASSLNKGTMIDDRGKRVPMGQAMEAFGVGEDTKTIPHFVSGWAHAERDHIKHLRS